MHQLRDSDLLQKLIGSFLVHTTPFNEFHENRANSRTIILLTDNKTNQPTNKQTERTTRKLKDISQLLY